MQIQTIKYGLNDRKWMKNKPDILILLYLSTLSDMNFQTILMPKVILIKILSQRDLLTWTILIFKYALGC